MKFKTEKYKDLVIRYDISDDGKFNSYVDGIGSNYSTARGGGADTFKRAQIEAQEKIDKFVSKQPKTYKELAQAIEDSLVWTHYEQCHVDEDNLKILIENFLKYRKKL